VQELAADASVESPTLEAIAASVGSTTIHNSVSGGGCLAERAALGGSPAGGRSVRTWELKPLKGVLVLTRRTSHSGPGRSGCPPSRSSSSTGSVPGPPPMLSRAGPPGTSLRPSRVRRSSSSHRST
jgi:hypothetical protein